MSNIQINKEIFSNVNGTRDLTFWVTGTIEPWLTASGQKHDIQTTVQKYKNRFKEAWEELSEK
ncbi:MAG: hypothetical protein ABSA04_09065 [Desulfobaccales bacterium]|jgi:hypothetical protein